MGQRIVKSLRKSMMVSLKKLKSETEQVVVGQLETARMVEMTRKLGSEIGFLGKYLSIYHHKTLRGGPRAMPSGVCQGNLCINAVCVPAEWHEQEGFLGREM